MGDHVRVLLEDVRLVDAACRRSSRLVLPIGKLFELLEPPALPGHVRRGPRDQACTGDDRADEVGAEVEDRIARDSEEPLQPVGALLADPALGKLGIHVAGQLRQQLPERQVGIADASLSVAQSAGDDEVIVPLLGQPGELTNERRLPGPRIADDETHPTPARDRAVEGVTQLRELLLAAHEGPYAPMHPL